MKKIFKNIKKLTSIVIALILTMVITQPVQAEYLDRAASQTIYFGPGIDLFPDKVVDGKITAGLAGVKYEKPIMVPASYGSEDPFTVAKLASVWARILELDPNPGAPVPKDVKKGTWYYSAFERLSKTHILDYLVDKNGNINPNRQLYAYEVFQSVKHYWDYSGFSEIKAEGTGFMKYKYGPAGTTQYILAAPDFHKRYSQYPWYKDVAEVIGVGFSHGLVDGHRYEYVLDPIKNHEVMLLFGEFTGRSYWPHAPGFREDIRVRGGKELLTTYEKAALQSRPAGFIN